MFRYVLRYNWTWGSFVLMLLVVSCNKGDGITKPDPSPPTTPTRIVFTSLRDGNMEIYVMNSDGTTQTRLTNNLANDASPAWSPDGKKIAFNSLRDGNAEIYVMNSDGTGQVRLTNSAGPDTGPSWSLDGAKIAFTSFRDGNNEIYVMNADGTNQTRLTNSSVAGSHDPSWSPDGTRIAFARRITISGVPDVCVINVDGTNLVNLTNNPDSLANLPLNHPRWSPSGSEMLVEWGYKTRKMNADGSNQVFISTPLASDYFNPSWSPDGTKIVFDNDSDIFTMSADGTNGARLTTSPSADVFPDWGPRN